VKITATYFLSTKETEMNLPYELCGLWRELRKTACWKFSCSP